MMTRIVIADDHAVVREGYRTLLEKHEGLSVVGEASNAASAWYWAWSLDASRLAT